MGQAVNEETLPAESPVIDQDDRTLGEHLIIFLTSSTTTSA